MALNGLRALVIVAALCGAPSAETTPRVDSVAAREFREAGVTGSFLLYDTRTGASDGYRSDRWDSAYIPASTFKIFSSLVALQTGVIADERTVIPWDSVVRPIATWNRDHSMATAFRASTVWFYQELARRIGPSRMQTYLDTAGYGNRTMGGSIDEFWLTGGLRITPREQAEFLSRLREGRLPFSHEVMERVRLIMIEEETASYVLRSKTGWSDAFEPQVGWYVGYVERGEGAWIFTTQLDIRKPGDIDARAAVTKAILRRIGILSSLPPQR